MKSENPFNLRHYLRADLLRARELEGRVVAKIGFLGLWLGIFSPRFVPVLLCRLAHSLYLLRLSPISKLVSLLNFFFFGIEIAVRCPIGPGIYFPHTQGTVIGATSIGSNVIIFQGVTLGAKELNFIFDEKLRPLIEDGVIIGAGAKIIGGVTVGKHSRVGANSVVMESVPGGVLSAGVPARVIKNYGQ